MVMDGNRGAVAACKMLRAKRHVFVGPKCWLRVCFGAYRQANVHHHLVLEEASMTTSTNKPMCDPSFDPNGKMHVQEYAYLAELKHRPASHIA